MNESHALLLLAVLLEIGVIQNGSYIHTDILHDDGCRALETLSCRDCRCAVEIRVDGRTYSFNQFVAQAERVQ
jgi:hypothetical protein